MSIQEEANILRSIPPFTPLDVKKLKRLALASQRLEYAAGECLVIQGEVGDSVFVVIDGKIDISVDSGEGPSQIRELGKYAFVGEISVLATAPRTATVTATIDVVALKIPNYVLSQMFDEMPDLKDRIVTHMLKADYVFE